MSEGGRVALVTNLLSHYRVPCFAALSRRLGGGLQVFLLAATMDNREYIIASDGVAALSTSVLPGWRWRRSADDDWHLNDPRPVMRGRFDAVILGGWDEPSYLCLLAWARATRRPAVFWVESTANDLPRTPRRELPKRALLRLASACVVPGSGAAAYCQRLGVPPERIFVAPNAGEGLALQHDAEGLRTQRDSLRRAAGLTAPTLLFVGRLIDAYKNVSMLLDACACLVRHGPAFTLLVAGDGPDRAQLVRRARELGLPDCRFLGVQGRAELARWYTMADVFVLPSRCEPWGFVVNESMEFGLPVVLSDAVGAAADMVVPGVNGAVVPSGDARQLASALQPLLSDHRLRVKMGQHSREIVQRFSPEAWASGVVDALRSVGVRIAHDG